jgi:HTTM domain
MEMIEWWRRHWFSEVPPHVFAAFRIAVGVAGCLTMLGMLDVPLLLSTEGIMPPLGEGLFGIRAAIDRAGLGLAAGWAMWAANFFAYLALVVGWRTDVTSLFAFVASGALIWWNWLPLSAAQSLLHNLTLYLVLSDSGRVWSMDARRAAKRGRPLAPIPQPVWPLRLLQYQLCVMYAAAAMFKLLDPTWRDGTALHYILNYNTFQRIPGQVPPSFAPLLAALGYTTLAWEGLFPLAMLTRTTRRVFVLLGIGLHLGMWALLDLGAFTPTVLAAYVAFIDTEDARALAALWARITKRAPYQERQTRVASAEEGPPGVPQ